LIARIWRGWTRTEDADEYVAYLQTTGIPAYRATPGNRAAYILRRTGGDRTEFVTLTFWTSLEAVKAFAGEDVEQAVFYPEDDRFLVDRETTVTHFEVVEPEGVRELRVSLTVEEYDEALRFYRDGSASRSRNPGTGRTEAGRSSPPAEQRSSCSRSRWPRRSTGSRRANASRATCDSHSRSRTRRPRVRGSPKRAPSRSAAR
jgi:heme-degrading monooxygenase HmoA